MRKLLSLLTAVLLVGSVWATDPDYTYTLADGDFTTTTHSKTSGSITWTHSHTSGDETYGNDATYGFKFGSGNKSYPTAFKLTSSSFSNNIKKVVVTASVNSSKSCKLDVKVGTTTYGSQTTINTKSNDTWEFTIADANAVNGAVELSFSSNTGPLYLKKIEVYYLSLNPAVTVNPASLDFGVVELNTSVAAKTFSLTGSNLTGAISIATPNAGFIVSPTSITPSNGAIAATDITVTPVTTTANTFDGNIVISGGNLASNVTVALTMTVSAPVAVTGVSLDKTVLALYDGAISAALVPTIEPSNATNKNVTWESSDETVATVANGVVTAVAPGNATITCKSAADATKSATCAVTVNAITTCAIAAQQGLTVSGDNVEYAGGKSFTIRGYVTGIKTAYANEKVSFWIADAADGGEVLQAYSAVCASAEAAPTVGQVVDVTGILTKYGQKAQFKGGCTFNIIPQPYITVTSSTIDFGTVEQNEEVAAKTVAVSFGYLTGDVTYSGLSGAFAATGTIANSGDEITITPSTATIGEYSQTLTIQSADDNKSVTVTVTMNVVAPFNGIKLTFDFVTHPSGWKTAKADAAAGTYTYTINETAYSFTLSKSGDGIYCGGTSGTSGYLMMSNGDTLGLPAIADYKLVKVEGTLNNSGNPSLSSQVAISDGKNVVSGGTAQTWDTKGEAKTYDLSGTSANTVYYMAVSNKNCQMITLALYYVDASVPSAIDNTDAEVKAVKTIVNGQLFIESNGRIYNAMGQLVK